MLSLVITLEEIFRAIRTHLVSFSLVLFGCVLVLLLFYPGSMSVDSWMQFHQAQQNYYEDWHPPIMAWVWHLFLWIKDGPQPMLFFHLAMFWGGLFLIWFQSIQKGYKIHCLIPLMGYLPSVLSMGGVIWKDIGLGASLVLVTGLFFLWNRRRKWVLCLVWVFLFYATAVRKNAPAATFPFFVLGPVFMFSADRNFFNRRTLSLAGIGVSVFVATLIFVNLFENKYLKPKKEFIYQTILFHDLAYIGDQTGLDLIPLAFRTSRYSKESIKDALGHRGLSDFLFRWDRNPLQVSTTDEDLKQLKWTWIKSVSSYPMIYLKLRTMLFKDLLSIGFGPYLPVHYYLPTEFVGRFIYFDSLRETFSDFLNSSSLRKLFFSGWIYVLMCLTGFYFSFFGLDRFSRLGMICFLSALLYTATYFPTSVACDFRYLWLITVMAPLGCIITQQSRD